MQQQNQRVRSLDPQAHDAGEPLRLDLTTALWLRRAPTAAFDALLDQADPQAAVPIDAATRANRRLCGRWLAVQRLRVGLTLAVVAERAGVDEFTVTLLESGLADEAQLPALMRERLSRVLASATHAPRWVLDVLAVAVGQASERVASVLEQVLAELHAPPDEGYDLFRRAIVERDADAWAEIHIRYRAMLIGWALHQPAYIGDAKHAADIADQAIARAWAALTPERFAAFPSVAALLAYLRTCVSTTVIDSRRAQASRDRIAQPIRSADAVATPEQIVLADLDSAALWRKAAAHLTTPAERVVLIESFIHNLPPRAIQAKHPQLFPDVAAVYKTKRSLLTRLQRSPDLQRLREDWIGDPNSR